jgi:ABC-type spermidine/putrescine transport system permease subunit I
MLENIALIASVISTLTAVTTSLRALGKARENTRYDAESKIKTGLRIGNNNTKQQNVRHESLSTHLISTIIWLVLSIVFAAPLFIRRWSDGVDILLFIWLLPFMLLCAVLLFIWRTILQSQV